MALAGCGSYGSAPAWDGTGIVTALRHHDAYATEGVCTVSSNGVCLVHATVNHPEEWQVQVTDEGGTEHYEDVSAADFGRCHKGSAWTAGRCPG